MEFEQLSNIGLGGKFWALYLEENLMVWITRRIQSVMLSIRRQLSIEKAHRLAPVVKTRACVPPKNHRLYLYNTFHWRVLMAPTTFYFISNKISLSLQMQWEIRIFKMLVYPFKHFLTVCLFNWSCIQGIWTGCSAGRATAELLFTSCNMS